MIEKMPSGEPEITNPSTYSTSPLIITLLGAVDPALLVFLLLFFKDELMSLHYATLLKW